MTQEEQRVLQAWIEAARDLDIRVTGPIVLPTQDQQRIAYIALICGFGSAQGTLLCSFEDWQRGSSVAQEYGYYAAALNPAVYGAYDRSKFIETLNDWGWCGTGNCPAWYTGEPWD